MCTTTGRFLYLQRITVRPMQVIDVIVMFVMKNVNARRDDIYDLREVRDIKKQLIYISEIDSRFRKERRLRRLDNRFLRLLRAERYENIHEDRYENYGKSEQDLYSDIKVIYRRWKRLQGYYDYGINRRIVKSYCTIMKTWRLKK